MPYSACTSPACSKHNKFDSTKSSTFVSPGQNFNLRYVVGEVTGLMGQDMVEMGGIPIKQSFGTALTEDESFDGLEYDGILGMGYGSISAERVTTPFDNLVQQKGIDKVYSLYCNFAANGRSGSQLTLGGYDTSKFKGDLKYSPVTQQTSWFIGLQSVTVNGQDTGVKPQDASIDSGTATMFIPDSDATAINKLIGGQPVVGAHGFVFYSLPCDSKGLPDVALQFNGNKFTLSPDGYMIAYGGNCFSGFVGGGPGFDMWLVGDIFLRNYYAVFDSAKNQVGFAPVSHPPPPISGFPGSESESSKSFTALYYRLMAFISLLVLLN